MGLGMHYYISPATGKFAVNNLLARAAEIMGAIVQALQTVEFGIGGHNAGDAFVVTVMVEPAVVADLVDGNGGRTPHH